MSSNRNRAPAIDAWLWRVAIVAAVIFVALIAPLHPYPGSFVLKAVPMTALTLLVLRNDRTRPGLLLAGGLVLSGVGDVALDLDRERFFIVGLAAFLVAHLLYIAAFAHWRGWSRGRLPGALATLAYAAAVGWLLRDIPADKLVPVMAYLATITGMVICAIGVGPLNRLLIAGAVLFMFSDTIIAVNKFLRPLPHSTVFNIGLYFVAQLLIVRGALARDRSAGG